jgi:hypothetical protein
MTFSLQDSLSSSIKEYVYFFLDLFATSKNIIHISISYSIVISKNACDSRLE